MKSTLSALGLALLAGISPSASSAATLGAQSIICDNRDDLALLDRPNLAGQSTEVVMKRVEASLKLYDPPERLYEMQGDLHRGAANRERLAEDKRRNAENLAAFKSFAKNCMPTGQSQQADILERRGVSGLVRIKTLVNGSPSEVWARASSLTE